MIGSLIGVVEVEAAPSLMGLLLYAIQRIANTLVFGGNLVGYESCFGDSLTVSAMHAIPGLRDFAVKQTIRFYRSYRNDAIRNQSI
jgi:hypothetical protein